MARAHATIVEKSSQLAENDPKSRLVVLGEPDEEPNVGRGIG